MIGPHLHRSWFCYATHRELAPPCHKTVSLSSLTVLNAQSDLAAKLNE